MAFIEEALRLFRESWGPNKHVGELAEEIASILSDWGKNGVEGPLKIVNTGNQAPLQIQMPEMPVAELPPIFEITFSDGSSTKMSPAGEVVNTDPDGNETSVSGGTGGSGVSAGTSSGGLLGIIVSGSGSSYSVELQGGGGTVSATHPQISDEEEIPAGRYVAVYLVGTSYYILEPTWI